MGDWRSALADYDSALRLAREDGNPGDPFVLNGRGNVKASLGMWDAARVDYLDSAEGFRKANGYGRPDGRGSARLDGEAFARSNAALMLAQIGEQVGGDLLALAVREMQAVARKAPQSVDVHAMLAAAYWSRGQALQAESEWQVACEKISTGCEVRAALVRACHSSSHHHHDHHHTPLSCDHLLQWTHRPSPPNTLQAYRDIDWVRRIRRWPPAMCSMLENFLRAM